MLYSNIEVSFIQVSQRLGEKQFMGSCNAPHWTKW